MLATSDLRIISLVPSITELLFDLGLKQNIIGCTKFCVHPVDEVKNIPQFGGTKKLHLDKIAAANPSLIIANKEENLKEEIEILQRDFEVMVTDVATLEENNQMIMDIGIRTDKQFEAKKLVNQITQEFEQLEDVESLGAVLYLIWNQPIMTIGNDTFIHHMLHYAGFENIAHNWERYPEVTQDMQLSPDFVFLSSEPFPFKEKHKNNLQIQFPNAKFYFVDGEMFSWYGSRIKLAPAYFMGLRNAIKSANR